METLQQDNKRLRESLAQIQEALAFAQALLEKQQKMKDIGFGSSSAKDIDESKRTTATTETTGTTETTSTPKFDKATPLFDPDDLSFNSEDETVTPTTPKSPISVVNFNSFSLSSSKEEKLKEQKAKNYLVRIRYEEILTEDQPLVPAVSPLSLKRTDISKGERVPSEITIPEIMLSLSPEQETRQEEEQQEGDDYEEGKNQSPGENTEDVWNHNLSDASNEGGLYTGSIDSKTNLPFGSGTMKYRNGREYTGEWEQGNWHGYGRLQNMIGDVYEGNFVQNQKEGKGKLNLKNGQVFEGRFKNNRIREGKMSYSENSYYKGLFCEGRRCGWGLYVFDDGSVYEGQWENDHRNGRGRMEWPDGVWYDGDWQLGIQHGYGMEVSPDNVILYEGRWEEGDPIGETK